MKRFSVYIFLLILVFALVYCNQGYKEKKEEAKTVTYLNHLDTVKYVGINTCKQCHMNIYNTYIHTGMGQSFGEATKEKSSAKFTKHTAIYDKYLDLYYHPYWDKDSLKIKEYRLDGKDTIYSRTETVNYVIGSGQHTNSHIFNTNGYAHQMPMTFYTQDGHWDFPPGYENGFNTRFSRKIGLECMSCHNALPDFVIGSENKYFKIGNGIDCERCHGPGSAHVQQKQAGNIIDTSKYIDYSIVNPGKLPIGLQFDVCQRCHLQGNAVLKEDKSFYDFKPGMKLSEVMSVFLPKHENGEKEFIMASHADRLKMSKCFLKSFKPEKEGTALRPYKESMTCVTCHNPHVSIKQTEHSEFNKKCNSCHGNKVNETCSEKLEVRMKKKDDCVSCHMPRSGSIDIPHVTVTDHFIRKPVSDEEMEKVKKFIGLFAVNEKSPDALTKAKAYIQQYEKFEPKAEYLDSAKKYLLDDSKENINKYFEHLVNLSFLRSDYKKVIDYVNRFDEKYLLNTRLHKRSWDNLCAWTCYRIGQSFQVDNNEQKALTFFAKATELAPFNNDFNNKLGAAYISLNNYTEAKKIFNMIIKEDPKFANAYSNLGYIYFLENDYVKAEQNYNKALALNPDNDIALGNKINLYVAIRQYDKAKNIVKMLLKRDPQNARLKQMMIQLNSMM